MSLTLEYIASVVDFIDGEPYKGNVTKAARETGIAPRTMANSYHSSRVYHLVKVDGELKRCVFLDSDNGRAKL
jgi:hypothetical protein